MQTLTLSLEIKKKFEMQQLANGVSTYLLGFWGNHPGPKQKNKNEKPNQKQRHQTKIKTPGTALFN